MNTLFPSNRTECSAAALSKLLERPLKFAEIAAFSAKCDLSDLEKRPAERTNHPFTVVVPAYQLVASLSRFVE